MAWATKFTAQVKLGLASGHATTEADRNVTLIPILAKQFPFQFPLPNYTMSISIPRGIPTEKFHGKWEFPFPMQTGISSTNYHERKYDGRGLDALDEPHDDGAEGLNGGEDVNAECLDVAQVDVVRLVLGWH